MVVRVENNNGQRVRENQGSALDQLRKTVVSYSLEEEVIRAELRWVLKMVESDYSFNSAENMVKLLCQMDKHSKIFPKMTLGRQKCGYYVTHALCPFYLEKLIKRVQEAAAYTLGVDGGSVTQRPEVNISPKNQYFFTYPKNGPARESRYPPGTWT